jgi:type VI secretion system secreted protein Hcp
MAVVDYFLKIEGIEGESADAKHKGEIQLMSWSWGVTNTPTVTGGGAGKASNHDFSFVKLIDKSSPVLMLSCANGKHHKEATLTVRKKGRSQLEYIKIKMEDLLVSSYHAAGPELTLPQDEVSLNFRKITYSVTTQKADGTPGPVTTTSFDFAANATT